MRAGGQLALSLRRALWRACSNRVSTTWQEHRGETIFDLPAERAAQGAWVGMVEEQLLEGEHLPEYAGRLGCVVNGVWHWR